MRVFIGYRPNAPDDYKNNGLTNSGEVADYIGVVFPDGSVALRWLTKYRSTSVWDSYQSFYQVHGHPEYGTRIEVTFDDGEPIVKR